MAIRIASKPSSDTAAYAEKIAALPNLCPARQRYDRPGRPASGKVRITLLVTPEVVEKFRATGKGWQARMNDALAKAKI